MKEDKSKKKTLTISSSFNKRFDPSSYGKTAKKSYVIDKKKSSKTPLRNNKNWASQTNTKDRSSNRNLNRTFIINEKID